MHRALAILAMVIPLLMVPGAAVLALAPACSPQDAVSPENRPYDARGDETADDSAALYKACAAAGSAKLPLLLRKTYRLSQKELTLFCDVKFEPGSYLAPTHGSTITIAGRIEAPDEAHIFAGAGDVIASTAPVVSVAWWGALAAEATDADPAPAIRAALGSNRTIKFVGGNYTLRSTVAPPCCAFARPGVLVKGLSNFTILGQGAKLVMSDANTLSAILHVDRSTHWSVRGLTFVGNRTNRSAGDENAALALSNNVDWSVRDVQVIGNWGGSGAIAYGDWLVDGLIENIDAQAVGICFDFAFLKAVTIANVRAVGADNDGNRGMRQVGQKCISNVYDVPNANQNATGISYADTENVTIKNVDASNFNTGWVLSSGQNYSFSGNNWHDNPGSGKISGIGGLINYHHGGSYSSIGFPPGNVVVHGDKFVRNGTAVAGKGLLISTSAILNNDVIANLEINAEFEDNNDTGADADTGSHISNVVVSGSFDGPRQTTAIGANLRAISAMRNQVPRPPHDDGR